MPDGSDTLYATQSTENPMIQRDETFDVAIIGGGPAGSTAGTLL